MTNIISKGIPIVFLLMISQVVLAQQVDIYKSYKTTLTISGTSTLHDWTMTSEAFTCQGNFKVDNNKITDVKGLTLLVPVRTLKSGKGAMDKNAYAALKEDKHQQIQFSLVSIQQQGDVLLCVGNLTIAGVTKPVEVETNCVLQADQTLQCKSKTQFKMTEYKVEPPSFMFGSVTTGDKIAIEFKISFKKNNPTNTL
ncbi:MAG: YceI family protein [Flammeovirgaceae bacterium]|jgi:polyisoprenoid-binding protein YceI|nr:YceI family protein [Flammeovirgaceae bacterium]